MNHKERVFIHIGHPKAASTTLQWNLFTNHPQLHYLGPSFCTGTQKKTLDEILFLSKSELKADQAREINKFWRQLLVSDEVLYTKNEVLEKFKESLNNNNTGIISNRKSNVISHEGMLNSCIGDNGLKAKRAYELFPQAKIIVVIRNQLDVLRSLYDMHPRAPMSGVAFNKVLSIKDWLQFNFDKLERGYLVGMMYSEHISYYKNIFGKDSVKVLIFEDLKYHPHAFSKEISGFMGIDDSISRELLLKSPKNTSQDHFIHNFREKILPGIQFSKLVPDKTHQYLVEKLTKALPHKKTQVPEEYQEKIRDFYKETNQKLITELGIDVAQYGYPF